MDLIHDSRMLKASSGVFGSWAPSRHSVRGCCQAPRLHQLVQRDRQRTTSFAGGVVDRIRDCRAGARDPDFPYSVHAQRGDGSGMSFQITSIFGTSRCTGTRYSAIEGFMTATEALVEEGLFGKRKA